MNYTLMSTENLGMVAALFEQYDLNIRNCLNERDCCDGVKQKKVELIDMVTQDIQSDHQVGQPKHSVEKPLVDIFDQLLYDSPHENQIFSESSSETPPAKNTASPNRQATIIDGKISGIDTDQNTKRHHSRRIRMSRNIIRDQTSNKNPAQVAEGTSKIEPQPSELDMSRKRVQMSTNLRRDKMICKKKMKKASASKKQSSSDDKGQTKNVIKNFGVRIVLFVKNHKQIISQLLSAFQSKITYEDLCIILSKKKKAKELTKIPQLRDLWLSENIGKEMRAISMLFLRKHVGSWIFNSKVQCIKSPLKYRYRMMEAVSKPEEFIFIKFS